ncbi:MAG: toll/interleukin-1 receptor domain-containing protein [Pseudomonadota bacterium]
MGHDVFLSHSNADKRHAEAICGALEARAIHCWVAPRDIRPGADWAEAIIDAMDQARVLVLVLSAQSNSSPQVRREVERAVNKGLSLLTFRIEDVALSKSLEYFLSTQHWLDAIGGDLGQHLARLSNCLDGMLAPPPGKAVVAAPAPMAPATAIAPAALGQLEALLALAVGPIAGHLVRRGALACRSHPDLVAALALEIDDPRERQLFLSRSNGALP